MIADDILRRKAFDAARHVVRHIKPLIIFGVYGSHVFGKHGMKFAKKIYCVFHFVFRAARVNAASVYSEFCGRGIEIFIFDFAEFSAVDRITEIGAESFYVEQIRSSADFLVGGESNQYISVCNVFIFAKNFRRGHDFRNAGFVVRAQKGCSVGHDEFLAEIFFKLGIVV